MARQVDAFWSIPLPELIERLESTPGGLTTDAAHQRRASQAFFRKVKL